MKKGVINGCLHTIYDFDEAMRHSDDMNIAIEEDGKVYPIISKTNTYKTNGVVLMDVSLHISMQMKISLSMSYKI